LTLSSFYFYLFNFFFHYFPRYCWSRLIAEAEGLLIRDSP